MAATRSDAVAVRRLTRGDDAAAWALRRRALLESPQAFSTHPDEHPALPAYRRLQAERRRSDSQRNLGAFLQGTLVGMVAVVREPRIKTRHRANLYSLYVAPEARRSGVGRALVAAAVEAARELGAERLELSVTAVNEAAIALYEGAGFRRWGVQPRAVRLAGRDLGEVGTAPPPTGRVGTDQIWTDQVWTDQVWMALALDGEAAGSEGGQGV